MCRGSSSLLLFTIYFFVAEIAQLVEHDLAKVGVASSSLVFRSPKASEKSGAFLFVSIPFLPSIHYICVITFFLTFSNL